MPRSVLSHIPQNGNDIKSLKAVKINSKKIFAIENNLHSPFKRTLAATPPSQQNYTAKVTYSVRVLDKMRVHPSLGNSRSLTSVSISTSWQDANTPM
jgi:hypothetical protein